jgi:protein-disulfide isomerase
VDGTPITADDVDRDIQAKLRPLQLQIHSLRQSSLEALIQRAVLEKEAARRGMTADALRKRLTEGEVVISPQEIESVYAESVSAFGSMSPDEARERVRLDLEAHARMRNYRDAVARLRDATNVEILLDQPKVSVTLNGATGSSKGPEDARVTVVEFADFECPYCRGAAQVLDGVLRDYAGDVRLVFKHLPLQSHAAAFPAARAAVCAAEQSLFWPYHDALFTRSSITAEGLMETASEVGLDLRAFDDCISAERSTDAVMADIQEARRLGIRGTPTFIINGAVLPGGGTPEELKRVIDRELTATRSASLRP